MSSGPQLEDGYVRIANELFEAILLAGLTARQWHIVMAIIRKTYGYGKKQDDLSASQIAAMCAMNRTHVTETLNQLARMNIINKSPGVHGSIVSIQKNHRHWIADQKPNTGDVKSPVVRLASNHYIYRVTLSTTGEFYVGVRSCVCHPNQDRYVGSGNWIATVNKRDLVKEVIDVFGSRELAEAAEVALIRRYSGNPKLRNTTFYESGSNEAAEDDISGTWTDSVQGGQNNDFGRTESVQVGRTAFVHTKDNLPKDNHQKKTSCAPQANRDIEPNAPAGRKDRATTSSQADIANRFERFYAAYPKRKSRQAAVKAFAKLNPDEQLLADMLAGLERAMKSEQWRDPQFVPHPATWLNAAGWLDEIVLDYSAAELEIIRSYNDALGEQLGAVSESIFVASRAAAIRDFCTLSEKPGFAFKFFPWVRDSVDVPPRAGFDYLISRQGFSAVKGGQHSRKAT